MTAESPSISWPELIAYYRACVDREHWVRLEAAARDPGAAPAPLLLPEIFGETPTPAHITGPVYVDVLRRFANVDPALTDEWVWYAGPFVRVDGYQVPLLCTQVRVERADGHLTIQRADKAVPFVNQRFFTRTVDAKEVPTFVRWLQDPQAKVVAPRLLDGLELVREGMLQVAPSNRVNYGLGRELAELARKGAKELSPALSVYLGLQPPAAVPSSQAAVTVVRSNPAQDRVLGRRAHPLQVVAGPPGTGKTQTIINLIASSLCDGQKVLFISKNNTAVDNVVGEFIGQELFAGILRLGSGDSRITGLEYARTVVAGIKGAKATGADPAGLQVQSVLIAREIAKLDEELGEVRRLADLIAELTVLERRTDEDLRTGDGYRWARERADQIRAAHARELSTEAMLRLRLLSAQVAGWQKPPGRWERLLHRLGLLSRLRSRRLQADLAGLGLPAFCLEAAATLDDRIVLLQRLQQSFPLWLATARLHAARAEQGKLRPRQVIAAELDRLYKQKQDLDRRRLRAAWETLALRMQSRLGPVEAALRAAAGKGEAGADRAQQFANLLSTFPVVCCTNLSLRSSMPLQPELFDLVVLDEASQSDIASLLPALQRAKRACIVGDDQQLSHITGVTEADDERLLPAAARAEGLRFSYRASAFDRAKVAAGADGEILLDRHYRCVPAIIGFCNEQFYGGRLVVERIAPDRRLVGGLPTTGFYLDDLETSRTEYPDGSPANGAEAQRVVQRVEAYVRAGESDIGVVTPFRAQAEWIKRLLQDRARAEADPVRAAALGWVAVGTVHTFQGGQHRIMIFSAVAAPGAKEGTTAWFRENKNLVNVAVSRAQDLLILVGHRPTLLAAGGILRAMVEYVDTLVPDGQLPPLPPGPQPARYGLRQAETQVMCEWLVPDGVAEVLNPGERTLYARLLVKVGDRPILVSPKMRVLDTLAGSTVVEATTEERDYAFKAHFDFALVDRNSFRPLAVVELDGGHHVTDPRTQRRDQLKEALCTKAGLRVVRVRWQRWSDLDPLDALLR